jgi:hypothetical protein
MPATFLEKEDGAQHSVGPSLDQPSHDGQYLGQRDAGKDQREDVEHRLAG